MPVGNAVDRDGIGLLLPDIADKVVASRSRSDVARIVAKLDAAEDGFGPGVDAAECLICDQAAQAGQDGAVVKWGRTEAGIGGVPDSNLMSNAILYDGRKG
ncbi:MAG: hypothetical protein M1423_06230 [Acidobacteria bacterium]|nr:hypothetical protein [Acidobacteriota bacterium]